jgi:hypothetical protein
MNKKNILKACIVLLFLYSRYTFYADAYPKMAHENILNQVVSYLKSSADFLKNFSSNITFPPEKSTLQKIEEYMLNLPAISSVMTEAKNIYKENFQTHFLSEVYTRLFSKTDRLHISQHYSFRWFAYDTIILGLLVYAMWFDSTVANLFLFGDALYKFCLLSLYHFRETPLERISNYFLSFFTYTKTFDIISMFKTNFEVLCDHRSVIATFFYCCLLGGFIYLYGGKIELPHVPILDKLQHKEAADTQAPHTSKISNTRETMRH